MTFRHRVQVAINKFKFNRKVKEVIKESREKPKFGDYLKERINHLEEEIESIYFPSQREEKRGKKLEIKLEEVKKILIAYRKYSED